MTSSREVPFRFEEQNADRITIWVESDGLVLRARDSRAAVALGIDSPSDAPARKVS